MTGVQGIDFLTSEFSGAPTGDMRMGTNGSITYPALVSGPGSGVVGVFQLNDPPGTLVNLRCRANIFLTDTLGNRLTCRRTEIVVGVGNTAGSGGGTRCRGLNRVIATHTTTANPSDNTVLMSCRLRVNGVQARNYNSSNPGGRGAQLRVEFGP